MNLRVCVAFLAFVSVVNAELGVYDDVWQCQAECTSDNVQCHPYGDKQYRCECATGGKLNENLKCDDINECEDEEICGDEQGMVCHNTVGSYVCTCDFARYTEKDGKCVDIDECAIKNQCADVNSECVNTVGSFSCQCKEGYEFTTVKDDDGSSHTECKDLDECDDARNNCNATRPYCINTVGGFDCTCPPHFDVGTYFGHEDTCIAPSQLQESPAVMYWQDQSHFWDAKKHCEDIGRRLPTCVGREALFSDYDSFCDWTKEDYNHDDGVVTWTNSDGHYMDEYGVTDSDWLTGKKNTGEFNEDISDYDRYQFVLMKKFKGGLFVGDDNYNRYYYCTDVTENQK